MWKRKNVALTGHGAMARLDRTVRTLRYYMDMIRHVSEEDLTWYRAFKMAVWIFNNSSHQFSSLPPQYLISSPLEMRYVRQRDYVKKVGNYKDMSPYYNVQLVDNVEPNHLVSLQRGIV